MSGNWAKRNVKIWMWAGLLAVMATAVPYLILGSDSIVTYHDQLDGELIAYILQARHLFRGDVLPEFMNGASKTALTVPAPLFTLLFLPGKYFQAWLAMVFLEKICAFFGMYLLAGEFVKERWIAAAAGVLYGCIPFLPVYGLSEFGIPMLLWCMLQIRKGKHIPWAYCYTAVFTLCSSLVLVGFGLLGMGILWIFVRIIQKKNGSGTGRMFGAWLLMLGIYTGENCRLLVQLLGTGDAFVSHKSEYVPEIQSFTGVFLDRLAKGEQHSLDSHFFLMCASALILAAGLVWQKKRKCPAVKRQLAAAGTAVACNLFFCLAAGFWNSGAGAALRGRLSLLGAFRLDRLLWMAPCLWYFAAACTAGAAWNMIKAGRKEKKNLQKAAAAAAMVLMTGAACVTGFGLLMSGDFKSNVRKLSDPDYNMISYRDYYALGAMEQVKDFLTEVTGQQPDGYRVVSLGIAPAAALYHGFYCLDGYSNNYSVEYKHSFRRVIAPELEKSEYLREYYDNWGNRCYLFSAEIPGYVTVEKNGFYFQEYRLDAKALYETGGRYLISAAYIVNAEDTGLVLLNDTPFETEDSYYRFFVYEVTP